MKDEVMLNSDSFILPRAPSLTVGLPPRAAVTDL